MAAPTSSLVSPQRPAGVRLQTQFVKLAGVYKFDFRLAYLVPPAIMLAVSATLFRRRSG